LLFSAFLLFSVTLTTQYIPKCIVKYLRILFLYSDKYIVTNKKNSTKTMYTVYKVAHTVVYIQNKRRIYCMQLQ